MKHHLLLSLSLFTALLATLYSPLRAQNNTASVSGKVTDSLFRPVSGATVSIPGSVHSTKTNEQGLYSLKHLPATRLSLQVSSVNYKSEKATATLTAGTQVQLNFVLSKSEVSLNEVLITASGLTNDAKDIAGTINILSAVRIRESGAQSVGEVIRLVPGTNFLDEDGRGLKPSIGLRGLDPQRNRNLLILVDGKFPIGQSYYGDLAGYYMMPLDQVDRIEVIKGASPVLYGGGSIGGVVNLITKSGRHTPQTSIKLNYGSFNSFSSDISTSGTRGRSTWYVGYNRKQGDGFRTSRSRFHLDDLTLKFDQQLDSTSQLSVYLNAFGEKSQTPGGLNQAQFDEDYRQSVNQNDEFIGRRYSTAISYKKTFGQVHTLSASAYGGYFQRDWWLEEKTKRQSNSGALRDIPSAGLIADYNLTHALAGLKNSLIVGTRLHTDRTNSHSVDGATSNARTGIVTASSISPSLIYEAYLYNELSLTDHLSLSPGLRYTSVKYNRSDLSKGRKDKVESDAFIYSFGLLYKLPAESRIYATVSRGFQPPQINSALSVGTIDAGVDLKAETSDNYELGFRTTPTTWLSMNAGAYMMYFNNKIINEAGINRNTGKSYHRGLEAEINLYPYRGLSMYLNGALQKATFENGIHEGKLLPYAPKQVAAAGLRYHLDLPGSSLIFNIYDTYTGKQYNDAANTQAGTADGMNGAIPAYNLLNATVNYSYKGWGLNFNVSNILDKHYFTQRYKAWGGIMPAPGRSFMAGLSYKL